MNNTRENAKGKWPYILSALGIDEQVLDGKHHPCPMCGGTDRFRFADVNRDGEPVGSYICSPNGNGCGTGDGFKLLMLFHGWDFRTACKEVDQVVPQVKLASQPKRTDPVQRLRRIQQNAKRLNGNDPASRYLRNRGIQTLADELRYVDNEPYYEQQRRVGVYPAMVGLVITPHGKPATYHVTYLLDGKKAHVDHPKKIMRSSTSFRGGAIRLGGMASHIGVAEGIETALAARQLFGIVTWAVLNTSGMECFVPPAGVEHVTVFADNDATYAGQLAAYTLAHRLKLRTKIGVEVQIPAIEGYDWCDMLQFSDPRKGVG